MTDPIWICDCGAINELHWSTCAECNEYKPRPCDDCGTEFVPWSETSKGNARLHKYQCRRCWLASADPEEPTHQPSRDAAVQEPDRHADHPMLMSTGGRMTKRQLHQIAKGRRRDVLKWLRFSLYHRQPKG